MPREFPVVAFLWQLCKHSQPWDLNSQTHSNPWLHTVVSHKGSQLWSWEVWLPARSPAALGTQAQEFTGFLPSENMELRNASCHQDIHPVANAESKGKSFQDLPQAVTCYWAAHRERRAVSCKPFYAQFIPILCIIKKWFASDAVKNKNVEYPPMPELSALVRRIRSPSGSRVSSSARCYPLLRPCSSLKAQAEGEHVSKPSTPQ